MHAQSERRPAVFFDRDGVIIVDKGYQVESDAIEFFPDAITALKEIDGRFMKVVISNQSGVARGYFTSEDVRKFDGLIAQKLKENGIWFDNWYFCPHGPDDGCACRKPEPGMIIRAETEMGIDLKNSWIIGDKSSDIKAGQAAGIKTILIKTGYAGREPGAENVRPDFISDSLLHAVETINRSLC